MKVSGEGGGGERFCRDIVLCIIHKAGKLETNRANRAKLVNWYHANLISMAITKETHKSLETSFTNLLFRYYHHKAS